MSQPMHVLLIDDEPAQAWLVAEYLRGAEPGSVVLATVETLGDGLLRLEDGTFDAVLLDLCLPDSLGVETYRRLNDRHPALPVVVLTSLEDEELGEQLVQMGAQDYLVKGQIAGPMLVRTLRYAIERRRAQAEREELIGQLRLALDEVRRLEGLLPICAWCHKIRDDAGYWQRVEVFIAERTDARFSHGICPSCMKEVCPDETVAAAWVTQLDVVDAGAFCAQLRAGSDPIAAYLLGQFSTATMNMVRRLTDGQPVPKGVVESLAGELNRIIENEHVYSPERFAGIALDPALLASAAQGQPAELTARILLNRRLLQAALPGCIAAMPVAPA
ncbi:MAG: response regulator [Armatimonadetes bacterium]|nr:response regulator [Armatimonadota bacterium]